MSLLTELIHIYERRGVSPASGLDRDHTGDDLSEFTWLFKGNAPLTPHLGIALKELYFLETALGAPARRAIMPAPAWHPKTVLIIGNSFGWSSFALAILCPQAQVVAVEIGDEPFTADWIERTNAIAREEGLPLTVLKGASPQAVTAALATGGIFAGQSLDLVFVDGHHTCEQIAQDLAAIAPALHEKSVVLCHDVIAFKMSDPVTAFAQQHGLEHQILWGTPSGIAVLHGKRPPLALLEAAYAFGGGETGQQRVQLLQDMTRSRQNLPLQERS